MQRPLMVMSGVGLAAALALALWAWLAVDHEVVDVAGGKANAKRRPAASRLIRFACTGDAGNAGNGGSDRADHRRCHSQRRALPCRSR